MAIRCDRVRTEMLLEIADLRGQLTARDFWRRRMEDENADLRERIEGLTQYIERLVKKND